MALHSNSDDKDCRIASWVQSQHVDELITVRRSLFDALQDSLLAQQEAQDRLRRAVIDCLQSTYPVWKGPSGFSEHPPAQVLERMHWNDSITRADSHSSYLDGKTTTVPAQTHTSHNQPQFFSNTNTPSVVVSPEPVETVMRAELQGSLPPLEPTVEGSTAVDACLPCFAQRHDLKRLSGLPHSTGCKAVADGSPETEPHSWLASSSSQCSGEEQTPELVFCSTRHDGSPEPFTHVSSVSPCEPVAEPQHSTERQARMLDTGKPTGINAESHDAFSTSSRRASVMAGLRKKVSRLFARHQPVDGFVSAANRGPLQVRVEEMSAYLKSPDEVSLAPRPATRLLQTREGAPMARARLARRSAPSLRT